MASAASPSPPLTPFPRASSSLPSCSSYRLRMAGCSATSFGSAGSFRNSSRIRLRSASRAVDRGP